MTDFDMNALVDRAQVYDSFVQLKSGADRYRLKSLQKANPQFEWPNLVRVADDGTFYLNQEVVNHQFEMELALTADEVDTVHPPTNTRTISYYIYQKNQRISVQVAVSVVYFAKDAASNKFLRLDFTFELEKVGVPRITGEGDTLLPISGRILLSPTPTFIRGSS